MKIIIPLLMLFAAPSFAQSLTATILEKDSLFWQAYNQCDLPAFRQFFTDDVEFYHDKGGLTQGADRLTSNMKANLCSNTGFGLRREVIEGSVKVYPLQQSDTIYGAIISGDHVFYILEKGKAERLDGQAKFTHVWVLKNGEWKMSRVLSYDHGPVKYVNKRKAVTLPDAVISGYAGTYAGPHTPSLIIEKEENRLVIVNGDKKMDIYPENDHLFFSRERDLTFDFVEKGLIVRESGEIVEQLAYKGK
ncbi:nuclear transport factor 2 family protein [Chitinophaga cymbidii]|uniref:DUF4440 domain-containing protein n=1 Tax=Chitinophaga cymbidii TaxID=1096750 RepID=A0A512RN23_9BACT|nr:nuclear transport factor 2 family protein [Chitinophaga cymbidii]GEP97104.1 hypothetical protein CCY01nite_33640 [Chitinophaga cymbidii]